VNAALENVNVRVCVWERESFPAIRNCVNVSAFFLLSLPRAVLNAKTHHFHNIIIVNHLLSAVVLLLLPLTVT